MSTPQTPAPGRNRCDAWAAYANAPLLFDPVYGHWPRLPTHCLDMVHAKRWPGDPLAAGSARAVPNDMLNGNTQQLVRLGLAEDAANCCRGSVPC